MQAFKGWVVGLTITAVAVTFAPGMARAAMIHEMTGPAEAPPASYTGTQYVDSRGCLFIRAGGSSGATRWVPRANRQRQVLCGYRPSLSASARQGAAPQQQVASGQPVRRRNYIEIIPDQQGGARQVQAAPSTNTNRRLVTQVQATQSGTVQGQTQRRVVRQPTNNAWAWLFGQPRQRRVVQQPQVAAVQPQPQIRAQQQVIYQQPRHQVMPQQPRQQVVYQQPQQGYRVRRTGPFSNPPAGTPNTRPVAVAGNANSPYWTAGNERGLAVRYGPQQVNPADYARTYQTSNPRYRAPAAYVTPQNNNRQQYTNRQRVVAANPFANSPQAVYWTAGNNHNLPVRYGPQQVHPADYYRAYQASTGTRATATYTTPRYTNRQRVVAANPFANSPQAVYWTAGNNHNLPVRYGPQAVHPADYYVTRQRPATAGYVAARQGAYGQRVRGNQGYSQTAQAPVVIPPGYEAVYPEGRLNPNRGVSGGGRVQGFGQGAGVYAPANPTDYAHSGAGYVTPAAPSGPRLMWTSYMPRKLYDVTTGQDVTAMYPELQYPYTDLALQRQQLSGLGRPTTHRRTGSSAPYIPDAPAIPQSPSMEDDASPANMSQNATATAIEDTAAPATEAGDVKVLQPSRARYVQVGTFAQPGNATRLQARFEGQGWPTHARPLVRGGTRYNIVLLGPFSDDAALSSALGTARAAGFHDAFAVN